MDEVKTVDDLKPGVEVNIFWEFEGGAGVDLWGKAVLVDEVLREPGGDSRSRFPLWSVKFICVRPGNDTAPGDSALVYVNPENAFDEIEVLPEEVDITPISWKWTCPKCENVNVQSNIMPGTIAYCATCGQDYRCRYEKESEE